MSTPFQNRLVGTIIVAAAAVIFLPDILDGDKKTKLADFEGLPKAPAIEADGASKAFPEEKLQQLPQQTVSDEKALDDEPIASADQLQLDPMSVETNTDKVRVDTMTKNDSFKTIDVDNTVNTELKESATQPLPERAAVNQAWVIQLGSFRHKKNVDELVAKLKENGYTAFTKPIKTKNGNLTKVFIGPELSKTSLENKLPKLKDLTNVQGKLARFYPTK